MGLVKEKIHSYNLTRIPFSQVSVGDTIYIYFLQPVVQFTSLKPKYQITKHEVKVVDVEKTKSFRFKLYSKQYELFFTEVIYNENTYCEMLHHTSENSFLSTCELDDEDEQNLIKLYEQK